MAICKALRFSLIPGGGRQFKTVQPKKVQ